MHRVPIIRRAGEKGTCARISIQFKKAGTGRHRLREVVGRVNPHVRRPPGAKLACTSSSVWQCVRQCAAIWQCAGQCAAVRQCGSVRQCVRLCAAVHAAVYVRQCARKYVAVSAAVCDCPVVRRCAAVRQLVAPYYIIYRL
jgi:hypothetical protein